MSKIKVKTKDLSKALKPFTGSGVETIRIANNNIYSFKDDHLVIFPFKTGKLKATIPSKEISEIIQKTKEKSFTISDENCLTIDGKNAKYEINFVQDDHIDLIDVPSEFIELPKGFQDSVRLALYTVSKEQANPLSNILFEYNKIYSSNFLRVSRVKQECGFGATLSAEHFKNVKEFKEFAITELYVFFRCESGVVLGLRKQQSDVLLSAETFDKNFEFDGKDVVFPVGVVDRIGTTSVFTDSKENESRVSVQYSNGMLQIIGENEKGKATEDIKAELDFDDFGFVINPVFFVEALKKCDTIKIGEYAASMEYGNLELLMSLKWGDD